MSLPRLIPRTPPPSTLYVLRFYAGMFAGFLALYALGFILALLWPPMLLLYLVAKK